MVVDENSPPADCINAWHTKILANGIYVLTFITKERWIPYRMSEENVFEFGYKGEEKQYQYIPKFLPDSRFIQTSRQDGHIICFYYMPFDYILGAKNLNSWCRPSEKQ